MNVKVNSETMNNEQKLQRKHNIYMKTWTQSFMGISNYVG